MVTEPDSKLRLSMEAICLGTKDLPKITRPFSSFFALLFVEGFLSTLIPAADWGFETGAASR